MSENIKKFPEAEDTSTPADLPDDTNKAETKAKEQQAEESTEQKKPDRAEIEKMARAFIEAASHGTLKLERPFRSDGLDITDLDYDFRVLTGMEYADAMDSDSKGSDSFHKISSKQALMLFAAAAAKCTKHVDKQDVLRGLGIEDTIKACQIAETFFSASSRAGELRITRT